MGVRKVRTAQARSVQISAGQDRSGQDSSGQVSMGQHRSEKVGIGHPPPQQQEDNLNLKTIGF